METSRIERLFTTLIRSLESWKTGEKFPYNEIVDAVPHLNDTSKQKAIDFVDDVTLQKRDALVTVLKKQYETSSLSMPRFVVVLLLGGTVMVFVSMILFIGIPVTNLDGVHMCSNAKVDDQVVYDSHTIVAQIGKDDRWAGIPVYLVSPLVYAIGAGTIAAVLLAEASERRGVFDMMDAIEGYDGRQRFLNWYVMGVVVAIVVMALSKAEIVDGLVITNCEDPSPIGSLTKLIASNTTLFSAAVLNFVADAFMVDEMFGFDVMRNPGAIMKVILPDLILCCAIVVHCKQRGASRASLLEYAALMAGVYAVVICVGLLIRHHTMKSSMSEDEGQERWFTKLCKGFVPVVLIWATVCDLTPHAFQFTDPQGDQIPDDMRISSKTLYKDENGKVKPIGKAKAGVFNNRGLIVSLVLVVIIFALLKFM